MISPGVPKIDVHFSLQHFECQNEQIGLFEGKKKKKKKKRAYSLKMTKQIFYMSGYRDFKIVV